MRFLFINTGTKRQNAGIVRCLGLGAELALMGHEVTVLLSSQPENLQSYGASFRSVRFLYVAPGYFKEEAGKLLALLRISPVDVVHCMGSGTNIFLPALAAKRLCGRRFLLVADFEDKQSLLVPRHKRPWQRLLDRTALRCSDLVLCAARELADEYAARRPGRVFHLPQGFDADGRPAESGERRLGDGAGPHLGYLGSLIPPYRDQLLFLLRALPALLRRTPGAKLHILGEGPLRCELEEAVQRLGLAGAALFHGFVPDSDLMALLGSLDSLLFPFPDTPLNRYRCPHKAYLYARAGRPIVTNRVGEVHSLLERYPGAHFYTQGEVESFCEAVRRALATKHHAGLEDFYRANSWRCRAQRYLGIVRGERPLACTPSKAP